MQTERMFEEHEKPCDFLSYWTRDSTNQLRLLERKDKYALFKTPQVFLQFLVNYKPLVFKLQSVEINVFIKTYQTFSSVLVFNLVIEQ